MRMHRDSVAFMLFLGLLAALPPFGIDMILPTLSATGASLGAPPAKVGLTMSVYLLSLGLTPLVFGPLSDRCGRKPVVLFGCTLFIIASIGCAVAHSLSALLAWRIVQGAGIASALLVMAIIRDLFDGQAARARISHAIIAINVVPMIAPTIGAELLAQGGWRIIYLVLVAAGFMLLLVTLMGFSESARIDRTSGLTPAAVIHDYILVALHPVCGGYILVNAAAGGAIFAYVTGSSLFFINIVGLRPEHYGLIFGASAVAVMGGAFLDGRLSARGVSSSHLLAAGLVILTLSATSLLALTLTSRMPLPLVTFLMIGTTFAFGLISPNATNGAMRPMPETAGVVGSAAGFVQMMTAAASSAIVAVCFDGRSALSMSAVMALFALLAMAAYIRLVRPTDKVTVSG